jgi:gliding motility-associated-like protein
MKKILFLLFYVFPFLLLAQQVSMFQQFNGRYDYLAFGNTLNMVENCGNCPCTILTESSSELNLTSSQSLVAALLYWSGSGSGDYDVKLNGIDIVAEKAYVQNFFGNDFFSAYADVTSIVFNAGNGTYTLSELDLNSVISSYCGTGTNYGGWSIIVIYQDPTLSLNQIGVFDGFEAVWSGNTSLDILLENIDILSSELAKIGFLAWEGDQGIAVDETLSINGNIISNPPLNPPTNAFNSTNSFTNSTTLYNMDLDFYDIENVVSPGDISIDISLTSGQDLVIINNVITVINSELPDATINVDQVDITCGENDIDVSYAVLNVNSTDLLPANTPIAFYANDVLVGQSATMADIPIGAMEPAVVTLTIPTTLPATFVLKAVVDDDGTGTGIVKETDESNNEFELVVSIAPIFINPGPFETSLCDDLLNGSTGNDGISTFNLAEFKIEIIGSYNFAVFYYETLSNQTNNIPIDPDNAYQNTSSPQLLYVSVFNSAGCVLTTELTLIVDPAPVANPPTPLQVCDDDNDGFSEFNLTDKNAEITGGNPDLFVNYYGTQALAEEGDPNAILPIPYFNDDPFLDNVWARVEDINTGCFDVVELILIVNLIPNEPTDDFGNLVMCDEDGNGIEQFDLTLNSPFVLGNQNPADFTITYYVTDFEAQIPINEIPNPVSFISTGQTIWMRIENNLTECFRVSNFELIIGTTPIIGAGPFMAFACDDMENGSTGTDGISTFNLASNNMDISLGDTSLAIFYYETQADQDAGNAIFPDTAYQNIATPQTLFVSIFNVEGCEERALLTITVNNNPTPVLPTPLEVCDDDYDGFAEFTLEDKDVEIIGNEIGVIISYYETQGLAETGDTNDELISPYTNEVADSDVVWVRVEYDPAPPLNGTGCYTVIPLELIVNPLPDNSVVIEDVIDCQLPFIGSSSIILDTKDAEILNGQDPAIFDVLYFETEEEADTMTDPISSSTPFFYGTTEITLHVGILNTQTGCYVSSDSGPSPAILTFFLVVKEGAEATMPADPYIICDNLGENDGIVGLFTLASDPNNPTEYDAEANALTEEILGDQDPEQFLITYHQTIESAMAGTEAIPDRYENIINPQVIFARVTNSSNSNPKCHAIVELTLKVEQLPIINLEPEYRLCVDAFGNPLMEEEGEASPPLLDTGLDPALHLFEWSLDGSIINGAISPSISATVGGSYTVTVTEIGTRCANSLTSIVKVSSPPLNFNVQAVSGAFAINEVIHTDSSGVTETYNGIHVVHVDADGLGEYIFQLDDGPFQEGDVFIDVLPGKHTVTIKDKFGCGSKLLDVSVIDYPRFITPNQDGFHDTWNIIGIAKFDPTAKIFIFDRYGKLLKQISPLEKGWNGNFNGNPMPSSDYWFLVEYTENNTPKEIKGHFTLKR